MKLALTIFTLLLGHMLFTDLHAAQTKKNSTAVVQSSSSTKSTKTTKKSKYKKVNRKSKISKIKRNPNAPSIVALTSDETHAQIFNTTIPEDGKTSLDKRY